MKLCNAETRESVYNYRNKFKEEPEENNKHMNQHEHRAHIQSHTSAAHSH